MFSFRKLIKTLFDYLYPPRCPGCFELIPPKSEDVLCPKCRKEWDEHKKEICSKCGQPMYLCWCNVPSNKEGNVDSERHLVQYRSDRESMVFNLAHFMKNHYCDEVFNFVANELSSCICTVEDKSSYVITCVPRSRSSMRKIGHNQSYELAKRLSDNTGIEYVDVLTHEGKKKQKKLNVKGRIENAKKSYYIRNGSSKYLKNKTVFLVDDVVTTGSTVVRCAQMLKSKKADKVIVISIAKTVR